MEIKRDDLYNLEKEDFDRFTSFYTLAGIKRLDSKISYTAVFIIGMLTFILSQDFLMGLAGIGIAIYSIIGLFKLGKEMKKYTNELDEDFFEVKPLKERKKK